MRELDQTIKDELRTNLMKLEDHLQSDVIFFFGEIHPSIEKTFKKFIERLKSDTPQRDKLSIVLNTPGGSAETTEKLVRITRHHYTEVQFIVPDAAMSAGTIFCMSGDKIFMDYSSALGPIDPQVFNGKTWVPALGYLDKVEELIEKSRNGSLTNAEFVLLQNQDLAMLKSYEQARELTISLLKQWLVKYKFKNWTTHRTNPQKIGQSVTPEERELRATEIASRLGDNKTWHSHGRSIGILTLKVLRLEIEDYSGDVTLKKLIADYNDLMCDYIVQKGIGVFLHHRDYF